MAIFIRHPSVLILLAVLLPFALSQDSPSPSPGPAAADSSPPISSPPTPSQSSSPPSPPPSESPSRTPSPSPDSANHDDHTAVLDDKSAGSDGMSGGRKAGIAIGVIACAVFVAVGGIVYKKRRENIRRQQYAYSGRGQIQL